VKIRQIRLQNVKSYLDETIPFYDGVNFISGVNGAGKTTLIEAIGFAVFNCKPANIGDFVRYGSGMGTITVEIEANDNRLYRIVRKFGNTNSWLVFDMETESEVDLHGAADIVPFLKEILGIDPDQDLAELFEDIIGAGQGEFTTPFLAKPAARRDNFNRIFKVESYRESFEELQKTVKKIERIIGELNVERAEKEGQVREYETVKSKLEDLLPVIAEIKEKLELKRKERQKAEAERDILRNREKEINDLAEDIKVREERLKRLDELNERLNEDLKNALAAEKEVQESKDGYNAYLALQKEQEDNERQRVERDKLKEQLAAAESMAREYTARTDAEKKAADAEKEDIENDEKQLAELISDAEKNKIAAGLYHDSIKCLKNQMDEISGRTAILETSGNELSNLCFRMSSNIEKWTELKKTIIEAEKFIAGEAEIREKQRKLKELEEEKSRISFEIVAERQNIKTLEENMKRAEGGKCPFLDAECKNVEGGLDKYFADRIKERRDKLSELVSKCAEYERKIAEYANVDNEALRLETEKRNLDNYRNMEETYHKEIKSDLEQIFKEDIPQKVRELVDSLEALRLKAGKECEAFETEAFGTEVSETEAADPAADISELPQAYSSLRVSYDNFTVFAYDAISGGTDYGKTAGAVEQAANICGKTESALDVIKSQQKKLDAVIDGIFNKSLGNLVKAQKDLENQLARKEKLEERKEKLAKRYADIASANETLESILARKNDIAAALSGFEGLDSRIAATAAGIAEKQKYYDSYMKNYSEAMKVRPLREKINLNSETRENEEKIQEQKRRLLEELQRGFSREALEAAGKRIEELSGETAALEKELEEREADLKEYSQRLEEMDKIKKEINEINEKTEYYGSILETTSWIRSILNRAGARIASVYREHMAREAGRIYREISRENVSLEWREDYEIFLVDVINSRERNRSFRQLSGGEQMTAALAMRLALLKQLYGAGIGFFDEPTTNLDTERRGSLSRIIPQVTANFDQLFVISHDDSFDSMTENIVQLKKDTGEGTKLVTG